MVHWVVVNWLALVVIAMSVGAGAVCGMIFRRRPNNLMLIALSIWFGIEVVGVAGSFLASFSPYLGPMLTEGEWGENWFGLIQGGLWGIGALCSYNLPRLFRQHQTLLVASA